MATSQICLKYYLACSGTSWAFLLALGAPGHVAFGTYWSARSFILGLRLALPEPTSTGEHSSILYISSLDYDLESRAFCILTRKPS